MDMIIRRRLRGLRLGRGWSLENLAGRCGLSPSTLSRLETGRRRIALDQLVPIARALDTTLDALVEPVGQNDVVIRPEAGHAQGLTTWILSDERALQGKVVAKMRITAERPAQVGSHPGRDWFTVLSGTARLVLGERTLLVHPGEVAEFSTMVPHSIGAHGGPVEILSILSHDGGLAHLHGPAAAGPARAPLGRAELGQDQPDRGADQQDHDHGAERPQQQGQMPAAAPHGPDEHREPGDEQPGTEVAQGGRGEHGAEQHGDG